MPGSARRHGHTPKSATVPPLEIATLSADDVRANLQITGRVSERAVPLLATVLHTHLRAGRRRLCVDVRAAALSDAALRCLAEWADDAAAHGGALVLENAPPQAAQAVASLRRTPVHA